MSGYFDNGNHRAMKSREMVNCSHLGLMEPKGSSPADILSPECAEIRGQRLESVQRPVPATDLATAFAEFMIASSRLEQKYQGLQQELSELRQELARRNAALKSTVAENDRMRLALQEIVDSMPCGVLVYSGEGAISIMNPECMRLLQITPADSRTSDGMTIEELSSRSGVNLALFRAHDCGGDSAYEFCLEGKHGSRWLEGRIRRLSAPNGLNTNGEKNDQMILILRDLTSQKRAEVDREAGRNAMALAEMSAELAHEIRNPLASLELFAGLLDDGEGERKLWTSHMRAGIRSLSTIVNNVLTLRSSGELRMEPLRLSGIVTEALDFAEPLLQQAGLSLDWEPESREIINCNSGALQQLVLNLVTNAIRYTPSGGGVRVSIRRESDMDGVSKAGVLMLEFADSGCGVPPDQIHRIFDRGYSGSGRSGLGLAVCERIMREHGGSISVVNGADEGARFRLKFPLLKMESANV